MVGAAVYGVIVILFALVLLTATEWARWRAARVREGEGTEVAGLWLGALPDFALMALLSALALVAVDLRARLVVSLALLLAAFGFLWLTRFQRQTPLVYLSLVSAVTAALPLVTWGADWRDSGQILGSLALTAAVAALVLWGIGSICRRRSDGDFYGTPSFELARGLPVGAVPLVIASLLAPSGALLTGAATLLLDALVFLLLTAVWKDAWLTYAAALTASGAAQLALLSTAAAGRGDAGAHGLLTAVLAILLWVAASMGQRRPAAQRDRVYWRPLFVTSLGLALLAGPLSAASPPALLVVALAYLLLTTVWREAALTYAAAAALVGAAHIQMLAAQPPAWVDLGAHGLLTAVLAVGFWLAGFIGQRRTIGEQEAVYWVPLFKTSLVLTSLAVPLSLASPGTWSWGAASLLLAALVFLLLTSVWRKAALTYAGAASFVGAAHMALLSTDAPGPADVGAHGVLMAAVGLGFWLAAFVGQRRATGEHHRVYWRPLFTASVGLTLLAVPLSLASPMALGLVALEFLLAVCSFPAAGWLYAVAGSVAWAGRLLFLPAAVDAEWVTASVAAAFSLWGLGVLLQTQKTTLCQRLAVPELGYEYPLFNTALAAGCFALLVRIGGSVLQDEAWTAHLVLLPVMALFSLLMLRAYPGRGWVHASVALITVAVVLKAQPHVEASGWWLALGVALALLWECVRRALEPVEARLCGRLGIRGDRYREVAGAWSLVLFAVGAGLTAGTVAAGMLAAVWNVPLAVPAASGWWAILVAQLLAIGYLFLNRSRLSADRWLMAVVGSVLLPVWWIGAPGSPEALITGTTVGYYPLTTVLFSLFTGVLGVRLSRSGSGGMGLGAGARSDAFRGCTSNSAATLSLCLAVIALLMTRGQVITPTVLTLAGATAVAAYATRMRRWVLLAYAGGGLFVTTCLYAALVAGTSQPAGVGPELCVAAAFGLTAGASLLLTAAGLLRERDVGTHRQTSEVRQRRQERAAVS
jgi:hypothetical protein